MTLAEMLPAVRRLSASEKLKLIRILAEDLEAAEDISLIESRRSEIAADAQQSLSDFRAGKLEPQSARSGHRRTTAIAGR